MAQTSIGNFFAVRRKRTASHGKSKVRRVEIREELSQNTEKILELQPNVSKSPTKFPPPPTLPVPPPIAKSPAPSPVSKSSATSPVWKTPVKDQARNSDFSPQLQKFKTFVVESPSKKKPSVTRRLTFEQCRALAMPTPLPETESFSSPCDVLDGVSQLPCSSSKPSPASQRFSSLSKLPESKEHVPTLPLPYKFNLLAEKFVCVDNFVMLMQRRKETCTYDKLAHAVQETTRRSFKKADLARIKTVFPEAFIFRQEKNIPGMYSAQKYGEYQLTVESTGVDGQAQPSGDTCHITTLTRRKKEFRRRLTRIVVQHHKDFLASLEPPVTVQDDKLFRWHASFPLDTVPDVEEDHLPTPPQSEKYSSASEALADVHERFTARVKKAAKPTLISPSSFSSSSSSSTSATAASSSNTTITSSSSSSSSSASPSLSSTPQHHLLKGVSSALLERIRQKEAAKAVASITRNPELEEKLEMCSRLPELCRILRIYFVAEKKAAIPWETVLNKVSESHSSGLQRDSVEKHLDLLLTLLPHWVTKVVVRKREFLKINRKTELKQVMSELKEREEEIQQ